MSGPAAPTEAPIAEAEAPVEAAQHTDSIPTPAGDLQAQVEEAHAREVEALYNQLIEIAKEDPEAALKALKSVSKQYADTVVAVVKDRFERAKQEATKELKEGAVAFTAAANAQPEAAPEVVQESKAEVKQADAPEPATASVEEVTAKIRDAFKESPLVDLVADAENITYALASALGKKVTLPVDTAQLPTLIHEAFQGEKPLIKREEGGLWLSDALRQSLAEKGTLAEGLFYSITNADVKDMTPEQKTAEAWATIALVANAELALAQAKVAEDEPKISDNIYFNRYALMGAPAIPDTASEGVTPEQYQSFAFYNVGKAFLNGHLNISEKGELSSSKEFEALLQELQPEFMQKDKEIGEKLMNDHLAEASKVREGEPHPKAPAENKRQEPEKPKGNRFVNWIKHNLIGTIVTTAAIGAAALLIPAGREQDSGKIADKVVSFIDKSGETNTTAIKAGLLGVVAVVSKLVLDAINPLSKAEHQSR